MPANHSNHPPAASRRLICEPLEKRLLLAVGPVISEFMAVNDNSLEDVDGDSPDWIEVYNPLDTTLDLEGWHLTDDVTNLSKWTFPDVDLPARERLVLFASGKNRTDSTAELHTNFKLRADGEYLALVRPDGITVAHDYSPQYPPQSEDISYGLGQDSSDFLATEEALLTFAVPTESDASLDHTWTALSFDDSSWNRKTSLPPLLITELGTREPDFVEIQNLSDADIDTSGWSVAANNASVGINEVHETLWELPATVDAGEVLFRGDNEDHVPNNLWGENLLWKTYGNGWAMVLDDRGGVADFVAWGYDAETLATLDVTIDGFRVTAKDVWHGLAVPKNDSRLNTLKRAGIADHDNATDFAFTSPHSMGDHNTGLDLPFEDETYSGFGFETPGSDFDGLFQIDVESAMHEANSSLWVRGTFEALAPTMLNAMALRVHYNDGFVAYLNGTEVARRNAPESLPWNAAATASRGKVQSATVEEIDLTEHLDLLVAGQNVLALHGLNVSPDDGSFLLVPELLGTRLRYFGEPTPGLPNADGFLGLVADTKFSVDRGFFDEAFSVEITTETADATIRYTTDGSIPSEGNGHRYTGPIEIATTTTLRARAIVPGFMPSDVDTQTYVFLEDVLRQPANPSGLPSVWDGRSQNPIPADYGMDPEVVDSPAYRDEILVGLRSIPSISIVMAPEDLFGSTRGIYINSGQRGRAWEHPTSVEIFEPDGTTFQVDSGIRIHGYSWRYHSNTPKHSFRLEFRDEYGPSKLEYPLFPDAPVDRFDSIVLRAQGGRAWAGHQRPLESQYLRDTFARDTSRDMGAVDGHATLVHLYLNGLYWGLYNPVERPDAQMGEEYFGGEDEDYDALNRRTTTNEAIDGDLKRYNEMIALANRMISEAAAGQDTSATYAEIDRYVDIDDLIDFFLVHQYTTNRDGPETFQSNNQRAIGSRVGDAKFRFFTWDMEYSIWNATDNYNIDVNIPTSASRVYTALRQNAEFRLRYADHVHKHLFNDGALTPEKAAARWEARAESIDTAIIGESARWGDAKRATPYTRDVEWMAERNRLLTQYFPQRTNILLGQLRSAGLYPSVAAPSFSQHGGHVPGQFALTMGAPAGKVYYTLDHSDPRLAGGGIAPGAVEYTADNSVVLDKSTVVKARVLVGDEWSALNEATFYVDTPPTTDVGPLVISEVMYHPIGVPGDNGLDSDSLEFVEIHNPTTESVPLDGWRLSVGIDFMFDSTRTLKAGGTLVVLPFDPADPLDTDQWTAFRAQYGINSDATDGFVGPYSNKLDNGGERVRLRRPFHSDAPNFTPWLEGDEIDYDDMAPWPFFADGLGHSLHRTDADMAGTDPGAWSSAFPTPGEADLGEHAAEVVGRWVFYNESRFDGFDAAASGQDDAAVATDKTALLPGETATFENYTSYVHGLNGLMIDILGSDDPSRLSQPENFAFHLGNSDQPATWDQTLAPRAITVRPGAGIDSSDRVTIVFNNGVVRNSWLRVTVLAGEPTGLAEDDVFFFGNAVGEVGDSLGTDAAVTIADELLTRNMRHGFFNPAKIDVRCDFNRDGFVNVADRLIARGHRTDLATALRLISLPRSGLSSEDTSPSNCRHSYERAVDLLLATYDW